MKLRKSTSWRKWRNRFYRLEQAAAVNVVTREFLVNMEPNGDSIARQIVSTTLDDWLRKHAIGEIGEREIETSETFDWHRDTIAYRATVMAKRPYWVKHIRAEAKA